MQTWGSDRHTRTAKKTTHARSMEHQLIDHWACNSIARRRISPPCALRSARCVRPHSAHAHRVTTLHSRGEERTNRPKRSRPGGQKVRRADRPRCL